MSSPMQLLALAVALLSLGLTGWILTGSEAVLFTGTILAGLVVAIWGWLLARTARGQKPRSHPDRS